MHFQDLRLTFVTRKVREGWGYKHIMAITGHKTRSIFDRYAIVNEQDTAIAMAKLQVHVQEQPVDRNVVALKKVSG